MLEAGESLARFLEAPLVKAEFTAPAWSPARPLRWALAVVSVLWLLRRTRRSIRHDPVRSR
jgi:hypothetical protein